MLNSYWRQLESRYGLPSGYLGTVRQIESSGNPNAVSPTGATGPFQFTKGTARGYGLPLDKRTDEYLSADAAARLARDNSSVLMKALGRAPTGPELYMAHQQGATPAARLIANPDRPQGDATSAFNLRVNSGDPNAPSSDIVNKFTLKYNKIAGAGPSGEGPGIGPTKEAAAMQPFMAGGAPAAVDPTKGKFLGSDAAFGEGKGLIGMAMSDSGITGAGLKNFMGGPEAGGAMAGLKMMAQGLGGGAPAPAPPPMMEEENKPELSLLEMIGKKKRKALI